jgi:hypothetical protein
LIVCCKLRVVTILSLDLTAAWSHQAFPAASIGLFACPTLHATFSGVALTMICSIGILRVFKVHMPPALAIGMLAFVIKTPTSGFLYP